MPSLPEFGEASEYVKMLDEYGIHYPNVRETFMDCVFKGQSDCNVFYPFLTEEGICFTFNSPNHTSIYREERLDFSHIFRFLILTTINLQPRSGARTAETKVFFEQ